MSDKVKNALKEFARALLAAAVALVTALLSSCGSSTKVTIHDTSDAVSVEINQQQSNESDVTPTISVQYNPKDK